MKKLLFLLFMLTILFACSQPEIESLTQEKMVEISSRAMGMEEQKPDVYVEAGCLVFKNFNVRDSIVNVGKEFRLCIRQNILCSLFL